MNELKLSSRLRESTPVSPYGKPNSITTSPKRKSSKECNKCPPSKKSDSRTILDDDYFTPVQGPVQPS